MNSTEQENKRVRGSSAVIALGTGGIQIATQLAKNEAIFGIPASALVPKLAIETAESSRTYSAPRGNGLEPVSLPESSIMILTERTASELAAKARDWPGTRKYAAKLGLLPDVSTKEGAGGNKILALANGLSDLPLIDQRLIKLVSDERERRLFNVRSDDGNVMGAQDVTDVYLVGSGYGSTCAGLIVLSASRLRFLMKLIGLKLRVHVILVAPSVARTHDPVTAWANFGATSREVLLAMEDASKIQFSTFAGDTITHEPQTKLVDSFIVWGCSTGSLVSGDREETASSVGLLLFYLAHSPLSALSEAAFCDPAKLSLDRSLGYRGIRRIGLARFGIDRACNRELALNAARLAISEMFAPNLN